MKHSIGLVVAAAVLSLGACGGGDDKGGLTAEENQKLDNMAETLDASPDSLVATNEAELGNGEQAADTGDLPVTGEPATNAQ